MRAAAIVSGALLALLSVTGHAQAASGEDVAASDTPSATQTEIVGATLETDRDQTAVTKEELLLRLSEKTEQRVYLLSVITAVFLPLGLLTGLLGVNVGGIPGAETPWAFALLCGGTVLFVIFQLWLLRRKHWF